MVYVVLAIAIMSSVALLHLLLMRLPASWFDSLVQSRDRFHLIDGLRGYLAISVFIHHFIVTWYWKTTGVWGRPPETLLHNIGKVAVILFFMTTGFLFASQVLRQQYRISSINLFISRFFRIVPLYLIMLCGVLVIVFIKSGWQLHNGIGGLWSDIGTWLIFDGKVVNQFTETRRIIAGVDWTLKYEWLFYAVLPLLALCGRFHGLITLLIAATAVIALTLQEWTLGVIKLKFSFCFLVGWFAALLAHRGWGGRWVVNNDIFASLLALLCLGYGCFLETYSLKQMAISGVAFILVSQGSSLFGLLKLRASKILGDLSYGIYLLHGMLLYVTFSVLSVVNFSNLSFSNYALLILVLLPAIVAASLVTYLLVERPFILLGKKIRRR